MSLLNETDDVHRSKRVWSKVLVTVLIAINRGTGGGGGGGEDPERWNALQLTVILQEQTSSPLHCVTQPRIPPASVTVSLSRYALCASYEIS